jgi:acetyltransferase-like isoleucine patch superfamily enzyme
VGPGAILTGGVAVDVRAFVGAGAVVLPNLRVGAGAIVGAGAVVTSDVEPGAVVAGNPARPLRTRDIGDGVMTCPHCSTHGAS